MNTPRLAALALLLSFAGLAGAAGAPASGLDLAGMDRSTRAADDLFRAGNGHWLATTEIPADKSSFGMVAQLRDLSDQRVRVLVEGFAQARPGSVEHKIGSYYASFMDTEAIERTGLRSVNGQLDALGALRTREQLLAWMGAHVGVVELPIALSVEPDFKQPGLYRVIIGQSGLGLPDRDYYLKDDARLVQAREAYKTYLQALARTAGLPLPDDAAARVLALERQLAQAQWPAEDNRDPQRTYNPMTPAELAARAPGLDWVGLLAGARVAPQERLVISQPSYVTTVARLLADTPLDDLRLYLMMRLLDASSDVLPAYQREARFAFRGKALSGATSEPPRWQQAVADVNQALGEAVGQAYVRRHFAAADKARMQKLVGNLLAAYGESIDSLTWMTPVTKARARDKLSKYLVKIGYPDVWRRYDGLEVRAGDPLGNRQRAARFEWLHQAAKAGKPVDRREWGMTPQTVNAYYNPTFNEIVFPAAVLQPPLYNSRADDAVNYGAIGAVIGHEISHGFDDEGSQFDGDGVLANWWTEADRQAFEAIGARLVAQYDAYEPIPGKHINGKLTLGENIADLAGLQIAYKAYLRSLGGKPAPVIDGLTGPQRFFFGWSQAWREKMREPRRLQQLVSDPHSPAEFRANGAAINHDGFHEAFKTQPGDKMFKPAAERIRLW